MKRTYRQAALVLCLLGMVLLGGCATNSRSENRLGPAMVIGVSSDGRYAISSHSSRHLVLWDIDQQTRQIVSTNANVYSASDEDWNLFHGYGEDMQPLKQDGTSPSFQGSGKLLHLTLSEENDLLLSAGLVVAKNVDPATHPAIKKNQLFSHYGGLVLWDLDMKEPIANLEGNASKVDGVISPDGQWIISGDESGIGRFARTDTPTPMHRMASYTGGIFLDDSPYDLDDPRKFDTSGLIPVPMAEKPNRWGGRYLTTDTTVAVAFINDSKEFLRFGTYKHWIALFEAGNPWPQKYFDLGTDPYPSAFSYLRSLSLATSPQANVLVTGHRDNGGITVYRYDPEQRTLTKEWVGE